jgi:uncharacterized protein (TIGR03437 family)
MQGASAAAAGSTGAHTASASFVPVIGNADTRSSASLAAAIAPASMGAILGNATQNPLSALTGSTTTADAASMPYDLAGVSVTVAGKAARVIQVDPSRVDFVVPNDVALGVQEVLVTSIDGYVSQGTINVSSIAPALFSVDGNGTGGGVVLNAGTLKSGAFDVTTPENFSSDKRTRLMIFATGFSNGLANPSLGNDISSGGYSLANQAESLMVEAKTADGRVFQLSVEYAGSQGNAAGLDQIVAVLPAELKGSGNVSLTVVAGTQRSNSIAVTIL